jgi:pimeloyl-ACP methyl ester carboxylesterase
MKPKIGRGISWTAALTVTAGLAAAVAVLPGTASATAPQPSGPVVPVLAWKPCHDGFRCATAHVPLNYRDPRGATISIAVISHRATRPGSSLGWLFFGGGGPQAQITPFLSTYPSLPAQWRERYNVITFDPRGMGYSTQIRCYPSEAAEKTALGNLAAGFPVGKAQEDAYERAYAKLDARCARDAGPLLEHDSSADTARDMNLLREAVGDPVLNYYGASYDTLLGAIYANLFPATTGRMILDGNINPVAWTAGDSRVPVYIRDDAAQGSQTTMTAFLDLCGKAAAKACAFSAGTPAETTAKWDTLLRLARKHSITITGPQAGTYTYADVIDVPGQYLGFVAKWQLMATTMQELWTAATNGKPASSLAPRSSRASSSTSGSSLYWGPEQPAAVMCADGPNPRDLAAYAATTANVFTPSWTWNSYVCADWPAAAAQDRYTGPWNRPTASTILVIGNTHDPDTAYQNSVAMSHDLARARLLTVDGYGHTTGQNPSACAFTYVINYTLTGALPAPGTVCQQDATPFPSAASLSG